MFTLLQKVWFDLWQDKSRTLQVVLVIALGAIGIGLVIGGRNLISTSVLEGWKTAEPAHLKLSVTPAMTAAEIERLERIEGVAQAEGLMSAPIEWRFPGDEEWQTGLLNGRDNYTEQKMALDGLVSGQWPGRNTVGIGQISVGVDQVFEGDVVEMRFGETVRTFPVVGTLDPVGPTPVFAENFYADARTFTRLTGIDTYDLVQMRDTTFSLAAAEATDLRVQDYFEEIGVDSVGILFPFNDRITPPDVPPGEAILNGLFLLLGLLGGIVVILGIFLVYNSISAIISQQVNQIGVMKAIGANSQQVVWSYLLLVLSYGVLAALISIPIGAAAATGLQRFFANFLNLEVYTIRVDPTAVYTQIAIAIIAPLLAALIPLRSGMKITVREAISTFGITGAVGFIDQAVTKLSRVPYTIVLTIGNTFRNRRRVLIIEIALIVSGAIFMMVIGLNDATKYTFGDKLLEVHNYQATLALENAERSQTLEMVADSVAGITAVDTWLVLTASARPVSQSEKEVTDARLTVFGQNPETDFYSPLMEEGRWLLPTDTNAAVVSQLIAGQEGWQVGDEITLEGGNGRSFNVEIVGIHFDPATNTSIHLPLNTVQQEWRYAGLANTLWVQTADQSAAAQLAVADELSALLEQQGIGVRSGSTFGDTTIAEISANATESFDIILNLLAVMAVVIALVGGVGLSGILSLSVLERRREIGVMRAIGASSWQVTRLFIGEGVLLGLISWLIALPLSIPIAFLFSKYALSFALNQQLVYRFTPAGAINWLVIITVLAIFASALPARGAARISVRESLAYS